jgi:TM2 domain-containing membrane protein YozV
MKILNKFFSKGDRKFILHLYLIAIGVFIVTLLVNELVIVVSGDFYLQQIPFYYKLFFEFWQLFLIIEKA